MKKTNMEDNKPLAALRRAQRDGRALWGHANDSLTIILMVMCMVILAGSYVAQDVLIPLVTK